MLNTLDEVAQRVPERLQANFADFNAENQLPYRVEMSIGMARVPFEDTMSLVDIINQADAAANDNKREPKEQTTLIPAPAMSDECAEMMRVDKSDPDKPCQGLTLDCIAKMGCALPLAVATPAASIATFDHRAGPVDQLPITRLFGRTLGPEPEPPLFPG